ncbi:MAG: alkaline phosphatase, partial [Sphingobacteriales bacterium]
MLVALLRPFICRSQPIVCLFLLLNALPGHAQKFAIIGDFGSNQKGGKRVAKLVKSWDPEFIITLGDNNYYRGYQRTIDRNIGKPYHHFLNPYKGKYGKEADTLRFFPSLGNHDIMWEKGRAHFDFFTLPGNERYYDFVWGAVHFFVLNSNPEEPDGTDANSAQAKWLKQKMQASLSPWKVVYFHHPPYTSGTHGSSANMRWPFKEWGADIVLSGHDHTYERLEINGLTYIV